MLPTWRLLALLLLTAPVAAIEGVGRPAAAALAAAVLLVALADWLLAADLRRVHVSRRVEGKLSLGDWNVVALSIANDADRTVRMLVRDVLPVDFEVEWPAYPPTTTGATTRESGGAATAGAPARLPVTTAATPTVTGGVATGFGVTLLASGRATVTYRVRPQHRGDYSFGDLHVRVDGPLGLVRRQRRLAGTGAAVRVYPSLKQLRRYELLVRRGLSAEAGARAIRVPGVSTEFERLREYVPDDEFRRINWKATARRGRPIVNQFEAERSQNVVIMIDTGRLMGARADSPAGDEASALVEGETPLGLTKLDHALNAALLLAYVAGLRGDRVALLAYHDGVRVFVPPARGRRVFLRVVDAFYSLTPEPVEADHGLAFQFLAARNLRRSLVLLFTDLADRESSTVLVAHLLRAARHHQVVCVTLGDPTVSKPAAARPRDSQMLYEKMVAQRLLDERAAVLATLAQRGVYTLDTDADRLSPRLVNAYLELKQRARI